MKQEQQIKEMAENIRIYKIYQRRIEHTLKGSVQANFNMTKRIDEMTKYIVELENRVRSKDGADAAEEICKGDRSKMTGRYCIAGTETSPFLGQCSAPIVSPHPDTGFGAPWSGRTAIWNVPLRCVALDVSLACVNKVAGAACRYNMISVGENGRRRYGMVFKGQKWSNLKPGKCVLAPFQDFHGKRLVKPGNAVMCQVGR